MTGLIPQFSNNDIKSIASALQSAGEAVEEFDMPDGSTQVLSRKQILSELLWDSAMPINEETGKRELGNLRVIELIQKTDPKNEEPVGSAFEAALALVAKKIEDVKLKDAGTGDIATSYEIKEGGNDAT